MTELSLNWILSSTLSKIRIMESVFLASIDDFNREIKKKAM